MEEETQNKHGSRATHSKWNQHVERMMMMMMMSLQNRFLEIEKHFIESFFTRDAVLVFNIMTKCNCLSTYKFSEYTIQGNQFLRYNLGQKVGDKFTKLSKIGFSVECFTADFLQFFNKKRQNLTFCWSAGYSPFNSNISGIFLKHPNFLRS